MIDKNERKKKYLLQYGSLLILHLAIQKAQGWAIEAAGAGGLSDWAMRLLALPAAVPMLLAFWITFRNERIHILIRWWLKFLFAALVVMLVMMILGLGRVSINGWSII